MKKLAENLRKKNKFKQLIQHMRDCGLLQCCTMSYLFFWDVQGSSLKMGPICCPETSVNNYQSTLRKFAEERRPHI